jgi:hypothetical protein
VIHQIVTQKHYDVVQRATATITVYARSDNDVEYVEAIIPGMGQYIGLRCDFAAWLYLGRRAIMARVRDVNDGESDSPKAAFWRMFPTEVLAVMCAEWGAP